MIAYCLSLIIWLDTKNCCFFIDISFSWQYYTIHLPVFCTFYTCKMLANIIHLEELSYQITITKKISLHLL